MCAVHDDAGRVHGAAVCGGVLGVCSPLVVADEAAADCTSDIMSAFNNTHMTFGRRTRKCTQIITSVIKLLWGTSGWGTGSDAAASLDVCACYQCARAHSANNARACTSVCASDNL